MLVCALGGEGGGVLAEWLVETATRAAATARRARRSPASRSAPARRPTTSRSSRVPDRELDGRRPVFSLNPVPGAIDLLVSSELLETVRQIGNGMATRERTQVVSSTSRTLDDRREDAARRRPRVERRDLLRCVRAAQPRRAGVRHGRRRAREPAPSISAVLFGAIAASGVLPFARDACEQTIAPLGQGRGRQPARLRRGVRDRRRVARASATRCGPRWRGEPSAVLAAAVADRRRPRRRGAAGVPAGDARARRRSATLASSSTRIAPTPSSTCERLQRVLRRRARRRPGTAPTASTTTRAAARYLALWMAFDDIVRVAELKCRAQPLRPRAPRGQGRRRRRACASSITSSPACAEFAGLLPRALAARADPLGARAASRAAATPFALPLKLAQPHGLGLPRAARARRR